jgi:hypothetical protein
MPAAQSSSFAFAGRPVVVVDSAPAPMARRGGTDRVCHCEHSRRLARGGTNLPNVTRHPAAFLRVRSGRLQLPRSGHVPRVRAPARTCRCQLWQLRASGYPRPMVTFLTLDAAHIRAILAA